MAQAAVIDFVNASPDTDPIVTVQIEPRDTPIAIDLRLPSVLDGISVYMTPTGNDTQVPLPRGECTALEMEPLAESELSNVTLTGEHNTTVALCIDNVVVAVAYYVLEDIGVTDEVCFIVLVMTGPRLLL